MPTGYIGSSSFSGKRPPNEMDKRETEGCINHLACRRRVSASTQPGAPNAVTFLYHTVLQKEIPDYDKQKVSICS